MLVPVHKPQPSPAYQSIYTYTQYTTCIQWVCPGTGIHCVMIALLYLMKSNVCECKDSYCCSSGECMPHAVAYVVLYVYMYISNKT